MIPAGSSLFELQTIDGYRKSFTSRSLWEPHIRAVFHQQGWKCGQILPGKPGTFPTFLVDDERVIKFFGPLFTGEQCWQVEQESAGLMTALPSIPVPRLLASGDVTGETGWHYLVFQALEGISLGEVYTKLSQGEKLRLVSWLGEWMQQLHRLPVPHTTRLPRLSLEMMRNWFSQRWHEDTYRWPKHLATQVEAYIAANIHLLESIADIFIHADLTQDHLLGRLEHGRWITSGVIDFGDAMLGNFPYELVALHLDLFACDKSLLAAFLARYGFTPDMLFSRRIMITSLMHQFDAVGYLFDWKPELRQVQTLDELESTLWKLDE